MDRFVKKPFSQHLALVIGSTLISVNVSTYAATGYFQLHNLMSSAQKNIPNHVFYNDSKLNLEYQEKNTGRVVNTQFANDGGVAGCGVTSTLMQYMYQQAGGVDLSKNYIALNVFSQIIGFDPQAPFWGNPEGQLKGYLTQLGGLTNVAYPNIPYHRVIPSLYPAYLGLFNNGLNCGRWVEADFDMQSCNDRTTPSGVSKFCPSVPALNYAGQKMQAYVFDSCEDNNGWCRDDAAHIDVNASALIPPANYYLQWKFIKNPYYTNPSAPPSLKDVWLAWFSQASQYWSYVAILNAENGISNVSYNIGDPNNPTWVNSHVLAGDNNVTWSSTSNNGQLWQVEPVNALSDSAPSANPLYQMRMFDYLGYPTNHGAIYQFKLLFEDGTLGQNVGGFSLFYQGGSTVKPGPQTQNMTILPAPVGTGKITIAFNNWLPNNVSLDSTQSNYLRPVLISDDGYAWDADQCANKQCVFSKLPTSSTYHVFAHALQDVSNDLTLRKVHEIVVNSAPLSFPNGSNAFGYALKVTDLNISIQYSARVQIPLKFATNDLTPINANLQALFVPNVTKNNASNITTQTQGCFLNTYVNAITDTTPNFNGNYTTCTVYYTVNRISNFSIVNPPAATFNVILPAKVGFDPVNYSLSAPYNNSVQVVGYNPTSTSAPPVQKMPIANYVASNGTSRSLFLMLDPQSDAACLQNLDPLLGVNVAIGSATNVTLKKVDVPIEIQLTEPTASISAQANLIPSANVSCQALPALVPNAGSPLKPGIDVVEVIKLAVIPKAVPPKPPTQGIAAIANGDTMCLGAHDILSFSSNGTVMASVPYVPSTFSTNVGVKVSPGTYRISDQAVNVPGGTCQLSNTQSATIQHNTFTPITLNYKFTKAAGSSCTATALVTGSWPNGCTVQFTLHSASPLNNVMLSWQKNAYDWTHVQVWGGEGALVVPSDVEGNVTWALPSWVNGQGSSVGMNVVNDSSPAICTAFSNSNIEVGCSGVSLKK